MISLNARSIWTQKFIAIAHCIGRLGNDAPVAGLALPLQVSSWLRADRGWFSLQQPNCTRCTRSHLLCPSAAIQTDGVRISTCMWPRELLVSPPPCVPLPAALPRIQGSSKALRKVSVIKAGETVLECEAVGTPLPTVTWVKDGQPVAGGNGILLTEQGRQLHIPKAEVAHAGRYACLVANAAGQERREFDIAVHGRGVGHSWGVRMQAGLGGW